MSRPVSIRDDTILEAARRAFLDQGYQASTADIARRAAVSEGSIFRRFKTKADLFQAAMATEDRQQEARAFLLSAVGRGNPRQTLEAYGQQLLAHLLVIIPRLLMISSRGTALLRIHLTSRHHPPPYLQHVELLARYLCAEQRLGRVQVAQPKAQATAFVGALSHQAFWETTSGRRPTSRQGYVRMLVGNLLRADEDPPREP